jgi:excisionase family DNA binding protein
VTGQLLTARDLASILAVSTETILRWTRRGDLPAYRLPGGAMRYRDSDLEVWLAERATTGRGDVSHPAGRRPRGKLASVSHPEAEEV